MNPLLAALFGPGSDDEDQQQDPLTRALLASQPPQQAAAAPPPPTAPPSPMEQPAPPRPFPTIDDARRRALLGQIEAAQNELVLPTPMQNQRHQQKLANLHALLGDEDRYQTQLYGRNVSAWEAMRPRAAGGVFYGPEGHAHMAMLSPDQKPYAADLGEAIVPMNRQFMRTNGGALDAEGNFIPTGIQRTPNGYVDESGVEHVTKPDVPRIRTGADQFYKYNAATGQMEPIGGTVKPSAPTVRPGGDQFYAYNPKTQQMEAAGGTVRQPAAASAKSAPPAKLPVSISRAATTALYDQSVTDPMQRLANANQVLRGAGFMVDPRTRQFVPLRGPMARTEEAPAKAISAESAPVVKWTLDESGNPVPEQ